MDILGWRRTDCSRWLVPQQYEGHLVIYVGKKISTIDFNVLDSKEYTFFIDNEFCRIRLERRGDQMYYFLK
ncbi:MAG: hypothetical protein R2788_22170 [Saprospiraceae bacterium]